MPALNTLKKLKEDKRMFDMILLMEIKRTIKIITIYP